MKERGKAIKTKNNFPDLNCSASEIRCNKHPYSSDVGICPYCLTEKLKKLVCSECGKSRVSSCSCFHNRSSSTLLDVGRISFFIDNESENESKTKNEKVVFFRRSSSSCVEVKKNNGFGRRIKGLFGKKRYKNGDDINGVSRSVSFSNAKISDGVFFDSDNCFSNQIEIDRVCNFPNGSVFPIKGSDFSATDDSEFIDLNLSKWNQDLLCGGTSEVCDHPNIYKIGDSEIGGNLSSLKSKWSLWKRGFFQGSKK